MAVLVGSVLLIVNGVGYLLWRHDYAGKIRHTRETDRR